LEGREGEEKRERDGGGFEGYSYSPSSSSSSSSSPYSPDATEPLEGALLYVLSKRKMYKKSNYNNPPPPHNSMAWLLDTRAPLYRSEDGERGGKWSVVLGESDECELGSANFGTG
jgi:hypothetical protein